MIRVYCDFDGTITNQDTIVFLTERFGAGPEYRRAVVEAIKSGEISVSEGIRRELATIRATWDEAVAALDKEIRVDPGFGDFTLWCKEAGIPVVVLSSGMMPVVQHFVGRFGIPLHAHAVDVEPGGWIYRRLPEQDKESILSAISPEDRVVFVGDGTSDVAALPYVDLLFAKEGRFLASYCRREGIPFIPFGSFQEVLTHLQERLEDHTAAAEEAGTAGTKPGRRVGPTAR